MRDDLNRRVQHTFALLRCVVTNKLDVFSDVIMVWCLRIGSCQQLEIDASYSGGEAAVSAKLRKL